MATRVIFGMSRDGLFTTKAAVVNDGGTPSVSLWLSALVAVLFIILGQTAGQVITIVAFSFVANYILSFISLFVLRRREPEKAATISRVGLSMDHRVGFGWIAGVSPRCDRERS